MLKVAFDPIYKYQLPEGHRFPMEKYELLPEQLLYEGTLETKNFFTPKALDNDEILLTHTQEYLQKLDSMTLPRKEAIKIGFPMTDTLVRRGKVIAGGTYACAQYAQSHGIALNIAGGTHHAYANHGEGFCVFNDIAISANLMLERKEASRILVIDLDVHQGNGTAHIFKDCPEVFTFSMHGAKNYPHRKEQSDLDIGLPDHIEGPDYLHILAENLPRVLDQFQPDFIFYLSGVDILENDKLGRLKVKKTDCKRRDHFVLNLCHQNQIPVAVSMGGGYADRLADIIDAHANTFRTAQEIYF